MNLTDFSRSLQGQQQHYVGSFFLLNASPRTSGSYSQICYYSRSLMPYVQGTVFNRGFRVVQPSR